MYRASVKRMPNGHDEFPYYGDVRIIDNNNAVFPGS